MSTGVAAAEGQVLRAVGCLMCTHIAHKHAHTRVYISVVYKQKIFCIHNIETGLSSTTRMQLAKRQADAGASKILGFPLGTGRACRCSSPLANRKQWRGGWGWGYTFLRDMY